MVDGLRLTPLETMTLSTSVAARKILANGSDELLKAFKYGAFQESEDGFTLRSPSVSISTIQEVGAGFFLIQLDALEAEMRALGLPIK